MTFAQFVASQAPELLGGFVTIFGVFVAWRYLIFNLPPTHTIRRHFVESGITAVATIIILVSVTYVAYQATMSIPSSATGSGTSIQDQKKQSTPIPPMSPQEARIFLFHSIVTSLRSNSKINNSDVDSLFSAHDSIGAADLSKMDSDTRSSYDTVTKLEQNFVWVKRGFNSNTEYQVPIAVIPENSYYPAKYMAETLAAALKKAGFNIVDSSDAAFYVWLDHDNLQDESPDSLFQGIGGQSNAFCTMIVNGKWILLSDSLFRMQFYAGSYDQDNSNDAREKALTDTIQQAISFIAEFGSNN